MTRRAIVQATTGVFVGEFALTGAPGYGIMSNAFQVMPDPQGRGLMPCPIGAGFLVSRTSVELCGVQSVEWVDQLDDGDRKTLDDMAKHVEKMREALRAQRSGLVIAAPGPVKAAPNGRIVT